MNYKSGDLVTITGNCNGHEFNIGETAKLKRKADGLNPTWIAEYLDGHDYWYVRECDMKPAKPAKPAIMPQKIVITTDGKTTLARLFDGKTMVKRAEAKCAPSDTFNFNTGADLALNRLLYGTDYNSQDVAIKTNAAPAESKSEPVKLYGIKDYSGWVTKGKIYEFVDGNIRFDEFFGGKLEYESFEKFKEYNTGLSACLVPLVRRPAKVGEWVLVTDSAVDRFIGTVGKVERINSDGNPSVRHKKVWFDTHGDGTENTSMNGCNYLVLDGYHGGPA